MGERPVVRLRKHAEARGFMSADDVARASGLRFTTVNKIWYQQVKDPSGSVVIALARAIGVSVESLYEDPVTDVKPSEEDTASDEQKKPER